MSELVAVARIAKPRGLKGEVIADILTDFPKRFDGLKTVIAVMPDGSRFELTLENHWFQSGRIVVKFAGVNSIEDGEKLRNAEICVPESDAVELEEGEYFDWQLAGCRIVTVSGAEIGKVRELMRTGATEILVVQGEKEYLIPFANAICTDVDIENKLITIDPPDGLLEF